MAIGEIFAGVTSLRAAIEVAKAMVGLRDAEAFRAKSGELQFLLLEALEKSVEARQAHATLQDRVRDLETEIARSEAWNAEKERYELKDVGGGVVAYMLKPDARGSEPPHWLCPNCYAKGQKAFFQPKGVSRYGNFPFKCTTCSTEFLSGALPKWRD